ncbi:MAG: transporter permease [Haloplasmataceae bacterium]|nr:transporter permease [Haloplasmataceae bacterium]
MSFQGTKINPKRHDISQIKFYIYLIPLAVFMLLPIIFVFSHAFKPLNELFTYPPKFFVKRPTLDNFTDLFRQTSTSGIPFSRYLFNSIIVTTIGVFATIAITSMAGYALSKLKFKFKHFLFEMNQLALMFVGTALVIPTYLVTVNIGILDTYLAHLLPILSLPVGLFLVKQFIDQVPDSLIEAAKLDGANELQIYWRIIVPIIKPALATVGILAFQRFWNDMGTSSLYVNDESKKTLAFFMTTLTSSVGNQVAGQGMRAASSLIMFIPNLLIFILIQNKVMDTMAHSGIK